MRVKELLESLFNSGADDSSDRGEEEDLIQHQAATTTIMKPSTPLCDATPAGNHNE